jgi:hypothetical protein
MFVGAQRRPEGQRRPQHQQRVGAGGRGVIQPERRAARHEQASEPACLRPAAVCDPRRDDNGRGKGENRQAAEGERREACQAGPPEQQHVGQGHVVVHEGGREIVRARERGGHEGLVHVEIAAQAHEHRLHDREQHDREQYRRERPVGRRRPVRGRHAPFYSEGV